MIPVPRLVAELGLPAVTLGRPDEASAHPQVGSVSVDDIAGVREVMSGLIAQGHRRIAHVTGPERYLHVRHRRDAWASALQEAGLPNARCVHTDFSAGQGASATRRLLSATPRNQPTAIVYTNDVMAIAGLAELQRGGKTVPDDISITGFDDTELARHVQPPLTTVRTDVAGWGERAATALLRAVAASHPSTSNCRRLGWWLAHPSHRRRTSRRDLIDETRHRVRDHRGCRNRADRLQPRQASRREQGPHLARPDRDLVLQQPARGASGASRPSRPGTRATRASRSPARRSRPARPPKR